MCNKPLGVLCHDLIDLPPMVTHKVPRDVKAPSPLLKNPPALSQLLTDSAPYGVTEVVGLLEAG